MAAEAPITAKKGEYSGLSSEDILALVSGAATTTKARTIFDLNKISSAPRPQIDELFGTASWKGAEQVGVAVTARRTGVAEENGETEKVT